MDDLTTIDILDSDAPEFYAPASTGALDLLLAQYAGMRTRIEQVAELVTGETAGAVEYFLAAHKADAHRGSWPAVEKLFELNPALAALDAAYWSKALGLTDVLDTMPQKRRDEWHKDITEHRCPAFEAGTVKATLSDLLAMRGQYFAERVDGIFRGLSGEHVTNSPAAFGKRMIIANVITCYDTIDHSRAGMINDLRAVIARFMGRDEPRYDSTQPLIQRLRGRWGEWVPIDGGAMRMRLYKKGTAHLEVHPDMAWRLNQVLASLYPLAIPPEFRAKPKRRVREFDLIKRPLPFTVVNALAHMEEAHQRLPEAQRTSWRDEGFRRIPKSRQFKYTVSTEARAEAEKILASIGGVKQPGGYWLFDYEPGDVLGEIVVSGCVPDQRAHQFYPTPEALARQLVELAEIEEWHTVLEPSAGQGGLAFLMPQATCVEVAPLNVKVLQAMGLKTIEADFLEWAQDQHGTFDRVVMNPPFSEGRWQAHLQAAAHCMKPSGRLAAILPASARSKVADLLPGLDVDVHAQHDGAFPGTSVSVVMVTAEARPF